MKTDGIDHAVGYCAEAPTPTGTLRSFGTPVEKRRKEVRAGTGS